MDKSIHIELHRTRWHGHEKVTEFSARLYTKTPADSAEHFEVSVIAPNDKQADEGIYFMFPDGERWNGRIADLQERIGRGLPIALPTPLAAAMNGSRYYAWLNCDTNKAGRFETDLFRLFQVADGSNREALIKAFPDYFTAPANSGNVRYVVTAIRKGSRVIAGAANHLNTYATAAAAEAQLKAITDNNNPEVIEELMGTDLKVLPVECYETGDPKRTQWPLLRVLSPDGFDIERDAEYYSKDEAVRAISEFVSRYERQGYYSTGDHTRIPLTEIAEHCRIVEWFEDEDMVNEPTAPYGDEAEAPGIPINDFLDLAPEYRKYGPVEYWAKKFSRIHLPNGCDVPKLGNNYADVAIAENRDVCPDCLVKIGFGVIRA